MDTNTLPRGVNLLSPEQAAKRLGCSRTHIYDLVAAGKLRRFGISAKAKAKNPKLRVADTDIDAYIAAAEMPVAS